MSEFLKEYLEMGLQDIVSIDYDWHEEKSGFQEENTDETIVAQKGKKYVKVSVHLRKKFGPRDGGPEFTTSETSITKLEYDSLTSGKAVMDTPAARQAITTKDAREKEIEAQAEALNQQLAHTAPKCPKCGGPVKKKHGKYGWFWSCSKFPKCEGTAQFSSRAKQLQEQLSKLYQP